MVRYAEWTPASRDERRAALLQKLNAVAILAFAAPASTIMSIFSSQVSISYFAFLCTAIFLTWLLNLPVRFFQKRRLRRMRDFPGTVDQFAVKVDLFRASYKYGEDIGLASFVDGWLHFEGHRCTFALPPGPGADIDRLSIQFPGPSRNHLVEFTPIEKRKEFQTLFKNWICEKPSPSTEMIMPPAVAVDWYDEKLIYYVVWTVAAIVMAIFSALNSPFLWSTILWSFFAIGGILAVARRLDERRRLNHGLPMLGHRRTRSLP